ncbi:MAG: glycosyltransferase family 4 protein [Clostridia bacterium]|nr:glycosyltransferase family 4 protein [Clostridia bacterium]
MRVLIHMGDSFPNEGPAANRMRVFSETLTEHGHEVTVIAPKSGKWDKTTENVRYCPTVTLKKKTSLRRFLNQFVFSFTSVFSSLGTGKADVVLTTSPPALIGISGWIIAKLKRAALVYDVRDIWPDVALEMGKLSERDVMSKIFACVRDFLLRQADLITTVSPGKVEKLKGYAPRARLRLITNGLDERFLENTIQDEIINAYGKDENFKCVYIGNLGWAQGLSQLLDVAKRAKQSGLDARFYLFGSGVEEDLLKAYAVKNGLDNVVFAGRIPNASIYTVLHLADMSFVSLVNEKLKDSVPTKLFEALGAGCPVLLAAAGDSVDILEECGLGIAVYPNDSKALWEGFLKLYNDHGEILNKAEQAKRVVLDKYSRQKAAELLETELQEIL